MNRTGLIVALAIAAVVGLAFGFFPQLDLSIAQPFHGIVDAANNDFALRLSPPLMLTRNIGLWLSAVLIVPAVVALAIKLILPRRKLLISGRAIVFLVATLALGPGLLVNVGLKDHWGRPRPIDVTQFGGDQHFVAWWDPRGDLPGQLLVRFRRRVGRVLDAGAGGACPAAISRGRLWRGARARHRHGRHPHVGGRAFFHRRGIRRRVHVSDHLGRARADLPLAAHAAHRRRASSTRSSGVSASIVGFFSKRKTEL